MSGTRLSTINGHLRGELYRQWLVKKSLKKPKG